MRSPRALPDMCLSTQPGEVILARTPSRMLKKHALSLSEGSASGIPCLRRNGFAFTRCSRYHAQARRQVGPLVVLTYFVYAPRVNGPAVLLAGPF